VIRYNFFAVVSHIGNMKQIQKKSSDTDRIRADSISGIAAVTGMERLTRT
jgi:hypothetical protein